MRTSLPPLQRQHLGDLSHQSMRLTLKGWSWKQAILRCSYFSPQCPRPSKRTCRMSRSSMFNLHLGRIYAEEPRRLLAPSDGKRCPLQYRL